MRHVLILAGPIADAPRARRWISRDAAVCCADGGAAAAREWGLRPAWVIGDLDSLAAEAQVWLREQQIPVYTYPATKDSTDTELALRLLLQDPSAVRAEDEVILLGALGGRQDHALANLLLAGQLAAEFHRRLILSDGRTRVMTLLPDLPLRFGAAPEGHPVDCYISIFALSDVITGVRGEGLLYPLDGITLRRGETRGVSNEFAPAGSHDHANENPSREISLSIQAGTALVLISPREPTTQTGIKSPPQVADLR